MHPALPAFVPGAPGGPELLIILFLFFIFGAVVVAAVVVLLFVQRGSGNTDEEAERIAQLEAEVEALKREREADTGEESNIERQNTRR